VRWKLVLTPSGLKIFSTLDIEQEVNFLTLHLALEGEGNVREVVQGLAADFLDDEAKDIGTEAVRNCRGGVHHSVWSPDRWVRSSLTGCARFEDQGDTRIFTLIVSLTSASVLRGGDFVPMPYLYVVEERIVSFFSIPGELLGERIEQGVLLASWFGAQGVEQATGMSQKVLNSDRLGRLIELENWD